MDDSSDSSTSSSQAIRPISILICALQLLSFPQTSLSADSAVCTVTVDARESPGSQQYWVEQLADGLLFPYSMAWLPNGDILVTERQGGLRLVHNFKLEPKPLEGVPPSFQNQLNGLKDILIDPDYPTSHALYLLISEGTFAKHHTAVYRAQYATSGLTNVKRIFRAKDEMGGLAQSSARMIFLPDKTLLIGVPENHYFKPMAQRLDSHIGKTLRINRDGTAPSDNPFLKAPDALPEIWSYGHRVQNGLHRDSKTGEIWEVEPGPRGGDELNLIKPGGNFGWAKATWGFEYTGGLITPMQFGSGMEDPILVWTPSVTPSNLTRYYGTIYPAWDGDFFVGHLSGKALERLRIIDHRVVLQEKLLTDIDERIRDVKVGPDGYIYILTDNHNGRMLRLQPGPRASSHLHRVAYKRKQRTISPLPWLGVLAPADLMAGKQAFIERCSQCHSVGRVVEGGHVGPDLARVYGRPVGRKPEYNYSAAMASISDVWEFGQLDFFLNDPSGYAKGTSMASAPVTEPEVRRQIIEFLKQQSQP